MVSEGRFREDLFYRLNVLHIRMPPLRERPEDIPALVHEILLRHGARSATPVPVVSANAMRALCLHGWRGNVRELSNVLERAAILADQGRIDLDQLPSDVRDAVPPGLGLQEAVERFERAHIAMTLRLCQGNRERAAQELGISAATLYRRLEKLGLKGQDAGRS
jgi:DNA-binding NtrC family response regulator